MLETLWEPIDLTRPHMVGDAVSWHGRLMVLAWGVIAPLAVLTARYCKVTPFQDWPRELDNPFWWRTHWIGQSVAVALTVAGVLLIQSAASAPGWHGRLGYAVAALGLLQVGLGLGRGTKGGPSAPNGRVRGDHYDMTRRRRIFEVAHKSLGYGVLALAAATLWVGLWTANAPLWMWIALALWWATLLSAAVVLQRRGWAVDTYQAIWGPSLAHPGNRRARRGWGVRRL